MTEEELEELEAQVLRSLDYKAFYEEQLRDIVWRTWDEDRDDV